MVARQTHIRRLLVTTLLAAASAGAQEVTLGTIIERDGNIVHLFDNGAACKRGLLRASRTYTNQERMYTMGCWSSVNGQITIKFEDGTVARYSQGHVIPSAKYSKGQTL